MAGGRGLCLRADRGVITTYKGIIFDAATFRAEQLLAARHPEPGARVAPTEARRLHRVRDRRRYNRGFSTRTLSVDVATGPISSQLEQFTTRRDGQVIHAADFNFWGVTFAPDDNSFYATLGDRGRPISSRATWPGAR